MGSSTSSQWTLSPEYAECDAFEFSSAEIDSNGCAFVFETDEGSEGEAAIECPESQAIEVVAKSRGLLKCRVLIGEQGGLTAVTYTNKGSGATRDVLVDLGLTGIDYTQEAGEGLGKCEAGEFSDGQLSGAPTLIGENESKEHPAPKSARSSQWPTEGARQDGVRNSASAQEENARFAG